MWECLRSIIAAASGRSNKKRASDDRIFTYPKAVNLSALLQECIFYRSVRNGSYIEERLVYDLAHTKTPDKCNNVKLLRHMLLLIQVMLKFTI